MALQEALYSGSAWKVKDIYCITNLFFKPLISIEIDSWNWLKLH